MKKLLIAIVALVVIAGGAAGAWYYASPGMTLKAMQDAAKAGDADRLAAYIDFPALRTSLKEELRAKATAEMAKPENREGFAALGAMMALKLVDGMVDSMITPATMRRAFAERQGSAPKMIAIDPASPSIAIIREGIDQFTVIDKAKGTKSGALVFRRQGLRWRLVGVRIVD